VKQLGSSPIAPTKLRGIGPCGNGFIEHESYGTQRVSQAIKCRTPHWRFLQYLVAKEPVSILNYNSVSLERKFGLKLLWAPDRRTRSLTLYAYFDPGFAAVGGF
jgi:hypothetical protein